MSLAGPPAASGSLAGLPTEAFAGRTVHRVWRYRLADGSLRVDPWWFASVPSDPWAGGRFDLPAPMGACSTVTRPVGAVLEALGTRLTNLPRAELVVRRLAAIRVPDDAPAAAKLTAQQAAGRFGVTAALWAGADRPLTQRWAAALRRDGWWVVYGGVQHDPSGRLRAFTLFDSAGAHPPTFASGWTHNTVRLDTDPVLEADLARFGVAVRDPGDLPFADPPT